MVINQNKRSQVVAKRNIDLLRVYLEKGFKKVVWNGKAETIEVDFELTDTVQDLIDKIEDGKSLATKENERLELENEKVKEELENTKQKLVEIQNTVADVIRSGNVESLNDSVEEWKLNTSTEDNE